MGREGDAGEEGVRGSKVWERVGGQQRQRVGALREGRRWEGRRCVGLAGGSRTGERMRGGL